MVMMMTTMIIVIIIEIRMTLPLLWILIIRFISIQVVHGYVFAYRIMIGPQYDVVFIDLNTEKTDMTMDDGNQYVP